MLDDDDDDNSVVVISDEYDEDDNELNVGDFFVKEENLVILIGISVKNNIKVFNKFLVFSI